MHRMRLLFSLLALSVFAQSIFARGPRSHDGGGNGDNDVSLPFGLPISFHSDESGGSGGGLETGGGAVSENSKKVVYAFNLDDEIGPTAWRQTQAAFRQAKAVRADFVLIHLNSRSGALDAAENIRQQILDFDKPVMVYIDRNAVSAGALISIACDSIYMSPGARLGAATVVDQSGTPAAEQYQSYMRSLLRNTATAKGRDPRIAEAMINPQVYASGSGPAQNSFNFTSNEALRIQYCNAEAGNITEVLHHAGLSDCTLIQYQPGTMERIIGFLLNPFSAGTLILLMLGSLYAELRKPRIGFALFVSLGASVLYFAPLYLEGLARNWEILLFPGGIILIALRMHLFRKLHGLGFAGFLCILSGLTLAMVDSLPSGSMMDMPNWAHAGKPLFIVLSASGIVAASVLFFQKKTLLSRLPFRRNEPANAETKTDQAVTL